MIDAYVRQMFIGQLMNSLTGLVQGERSGDRSRETAIENLALSRDRFEWEKSMQIARVEDDRRRSIQMARERRQEMLLSRELDIWARNWPLRQTPYQFLAERDNDRTPIKLIVAYSKEHEWLGLAVESGLRPFLQQHYAHHDRERPIEFLDRLWEPGKPQGGAAVSGLHYVLRQDPTVVFDICPAGIGAVDLNLGFWGAGQKVYRYVQLAQVELGKLRADAARVEGQKILDSKLAASGKVLPDVNLTKLIEQNAKILEAERSLGVRADFAYQVSPVHDQSAIDFVLASARVAVAGIADLYYLQHYFTKPLMPSLVGRSSADEESVATQNIIDRALLQYGDVFEQLATERWALRPEILLIFADSIVDLPGSERASKVVDESVTAWLKIRGHEHKSSQLLQSLLKHANPAKDAAYLFALRGLLLRLGRQQEASIIPTLTRPDLPLIPSGTLGLDGYNDPSDTWA